MLTVLQLTHMFSRRRIIGICAQRRCYSKRKDLEASRVPSNQFERIWHYGHLATGMGIGALGESLKRLAGSGEKGSVMFSRGNIERLVSKLSRMRGAALKVGQLISFQDENIIPPAIREVLRRLQSRANYMPPRQLSRVMAKDLGPGWREKFQRFDERPFAAASIGQVHSGQLSSGEKVAVKVQYPGVANSIDADLSTMSLLLLGSGMLPEGLFLDKTLENARKELAWECDYLREAENIRTYKRLLADEPIYKVPEVYAELTGPHVLTMQYLEGEEIEGANEDPNFIASSVMRLCLLELGRLQFMQTDPNWANFLVKDGQLGLLDLGAGRPLSDEFLTLYLGTLRAAIHGDREACHDLSLKLGYLTGLESRAMVDAHIDSIMILAEPFREDSYDFSSQTVTQRVRKNIGLMLKERLTPPPEETYSLHRKLSGTFLLCARFGATVPCGKLFREIIGV